MPDEYRDFHARVEGLVFARYSVDGSDLRMSGFEFHLTCGHCALASGTYPWRYDRVVEPSRLELPALDRAKAVFTSVSIPIEHAGDDAVLATLAARQSTADITVIVPHFVAEHGIDLRPAATCPQCGHAEVVARFGSPIAAPRVVASVDEAIAASRVIAYSTSLSMRLAAPEVGLRCQRTSEGERPQFAWYVDRVGDTNVSPVVDELLAKLASLGSECETPKHLRAFSRFREWPA